MSETQLRQIVTFEELAKQMHYPSEKALLEALYAKVSLRELAKHLCVSDWLLRKRLVANGIAIRKRGGAVGKKFVLTREVVDRVALEGIPAVCKTLGISKYTLWKKLAEWRKARREEEDNAARGLLFSTQTAKASDAPEDPE